MDVQEKIPGHWKKRRISDIGEVVTGRTPSTKSDAYYGGDYNLISPADLDDQQYVCSAHRRLSLAGFQQCRALPKDTVLVGCIGNVGKLGMVENDNSATNQQINAVICNQHNDPHFIYHCLRENRNRLEQAADRTTVPILNKTNFEKFEVLVPPLKEQHNIGKFLSVVQHLIEQQERLLKIVSELKKAVIRHLFTTVLSGAPERVIPEALVKFRVDRSSQLPTAQIESEGEWPVIDQGQSFIAGYTDDHRKVIKDGLPLIIFGDHTRCLKFVDFPFVLGADGTKVLKANETRFRPRFLFYALSALDIPNRGYNRHFTLLREKMIRQPPFSAQDTIIEQLLVLDRKQSLHEQEHTAYSALYRTLLHQLMTAKIRLQRDDLVEFEATTTG